MPEQGSSSMAPPTVPSNDDQLLHTGPGQPGTSQDTAQQESQGQGSTSQQQQAQAGPSSAGAQQPPPIQPLIAPRQDDPESLGLVSQVAPVQSVPITEQEVGEYREQDRYLPIANVSRIMKASVPPTAKIAKDAKECVQECVSEFISFITSEAAEKCALEKRKTIGGEDILQALGTLGFDNYAQTLKIHLAKLRQAQNGSAAEQRQQALEAQRQEAQSPQ